jgi:hypothetical protein
MHLGQKVKDFFLTSETKILDSNSFRRCFFFLGII